MSKPIKYSETFFSFQGEGKYTGIPSLWIRFFLCNLQCNGFGQEHPTKPETWDLPYEKIDVSDITSVEDLPVFDKGCDSSYTWAKKFKHLMHDRSAETAVDELSALLPHGKFVHPDTLQEAHMVFTGGEPMINQDAMMDILKEFYRRQNIPNFVTVETNGTKPISKEMTRFVRDFETELGAEWFWSVSPKLWSTAGEKRKKAICPEVVADYARATYKLKGQLKFVVNGSEESWQEVEENVKAFREAGCIWPVYIMGVGGTIEGLKVSEADIADEAIRRGYNYSSRVHVHVYGNAIGK